MKHTNKAWYLVIVLAVILIFAVAAIALPGFGKGISTFLGGTVLAGLSNGITGIAKTVMLFGASGFPQFLLVAGGIFVVGYILAWTFQSYLYQPLKNKISGTPKTTVPQPTMTQPQQVIVKQQPVTTKEEENT